MPGTPRERKCGFYLDRFHRVRSRCFVTIPSDEPRKWEINVGYRDSRLTILVQLL